MNYKGFYKVKNPEKYRGNPTQCVFRSLWERKFMKYCDFNKSVLEWSSEEVRIPYRSPIDGKFHYYYVDFWVKIKGKNGEIEEFLIEIKPKKQTKKPELKKSKKTYTEQLKTYMVNLEKWKSAKTYCNRKKWKFKILTEDHLFGSKS